MADATDLPNMRERFERVREQMRGGGGHGPTGDDETNRRITALETGFDKLDSKLDKIIETQTAERLQNEQRFGLVAERLAVIEAKIDSKASAADLSTKASAADVTRIAGRVESLPTTWQMITLVVGTVFTILGGSFLILKFGLTHTP